jgi:hypothetical protein
MMQALQELQQLHKLQVFTVSPEWEGGSAR